MLQVIRNKLQVYFYYFAVARIKLTEVIPSSVSFKLIDVT